MATPMVDVGGRVDGELSVSGISRDRRRGYCGRDAIGLNCRR